MDLVVARALANAGCLRRGVLVAHGVEDAAIDARLGSGEWRVVIGDVVQLSPTPPSIAARIAAVRLVAPVHRFTGEVAAAAWRLIGYERVREVVAEVARGTRPLAGEGVSLRRAVVAEMEIESSIVLEGLRVASEAETVRSCSAGMPPRLVDDLVTSFLRRHADGADRLRVVCGRGRAGSAAVRDSLARVDDGHWSKPERDLARALRAAGEVLRANVRMTRPSTGEVAIVDLYDPRRRRALEVDGWTYHVDRLRFAADRRRDRWLETECGVEVLRVAAADVASDPVGTAREVVAWLRRPAYSVILERDTPERPA